MCLAIYFFASLPLPCFFSDRGTFRGQQTANKGQGEGIFTISHPHSLFAVTDQSFTCICICICSRKTREGKEEGEGT